MTSRKRTPEKLASDAKAVAAWINLANGKRSFDVEHHFGFGRDYALMVLRAAEQYGIVKKRVTIDLTLWMTTEERDRRIAESAAARRKADALRRMKKRERVANSALDLVEDAPPVVQRIVPAGQARPLVVNAPRSVFEWGMAA